MAMNLRGNREKTTVVNESPVLVVDLEATCWADRIRSEGEPQSLDNM